VSSPDRPALRTRVAVPATSANLGPGFDILALALELQNEVTVAETGAGAIALDCGPNAPAELGDPERNLVVRAWRSACADLGVAAEGVAITCVNRIPLRRGLGSSAAAALGGLLAATAIHRPPWDQTAILARVAALEGHADNAAAALLGGLAICAEGLPPVMVRVPEELRCVVLVPDLELATPAARRVVPRQLSRADAVFNAARCALLVRAVEERDYASLRTAMEDRWHQAQRSALLPYLPDVIAAALDSGAAGAALSGAGPAVLALAYREWDAVGAAMLQALRGHALDGHVLVSRVRNYGARVDTALVLDG
jgi:homoserine kinase